MPLLHRIYDGKMQTDFILWIKWGLMGRADILLNMLLSPTSPIIFKRASIKYELLLMQNSTVIFKGADIWITVSGTWMYGFNALDWHHSRYWPNQTIQSNTVYGSHYKSSAVSFIFLFLVLKSLTKEEPNARHGGRRAKASFDYELMSKVQHPKCKKQKEK